MATDVRMNATVTDMSSADHVIKFLMENKIQCGVIDEIIERGFDSLEALSLLDAEDIKSQKIPVGQRRLLLHVVKSLTITSGDSTIHRMIRLALMPSRHPRLRRTLRQLRADLGPVQQMCTKKHY